MRYILSGVNAIYMYGSGIMKETPPNYVRYGYEWSELHSVVQDVAPFGGLSRAFFIGSAHLV